MKMPRKATKALSEQQLVNYIQEFFASHYQSSTRHPPNDIEQRINRFMVQKDIHDEGDRKTLTNALMMQHNACLYAERSYSSNTRTYYGGGSSNIDIILFPTWPYYGGCWGHHHHHLGGGGSSSADGEAALIMLAVLAVASALAAAYGMFTDLYEMGKELHNNQRMAANVATLAITGAAVVGVSIAAAALLASNPIGWGIVATSALVIGLALLVKGVRALSNTIDATLDKKSGLASDSRFQLTEREEANLRVEMGANDTDIEKIRGIIRGLAIQAQSTTQTGFFGSKDRYLEIVKVLTDVKNGDISPKIREQYGLEGFGTDRPEAEGEIHSAMQ
jgi:hypothetical protein